MLIFGFFPTKIEVPLVGSTLWLFSPSFHVVDNIGLTIFEKPKPAKSSWKIYDFESEYPCHHEILVCRSRGVSVSICVFLFEFLFWKSCFKYGFHFLFHAAVHVCCGWSRCHWFCGRCWLCLCRRVHGPWIRRCHMRRARLFSSGQGLGSSSSQRKRLSYQVRCVRQCQYCQNGSVCEEKARCHSILDQQCRSQWRSTSTSRCSSQSSRDGGQGESSRNTSLYQGCYGYHGTTGE